MASEDMLFENVDERTDDDDDDGWKTDTWLYHKLTYEPSAKVS